MDPDTLMQQFELGAQGLADVDMVGILWNIIADIQDSYTLAMQGAGIAPEVMQEVTETVTDYLANHYGEDY